MIDWWCRQGSIGEVSVVRRKWNLGSSQSSNIGTASNNNLEHLDSEAIAEANDGGGGSGGETMPVTVIRAWHGPHKYSRFCLN